jgi:hypothetical protein
MEMGQGIALSVYGTAIEGILSMRAVPTTSLYLIKNYYFQPLGMEQLH